MVKEGTKISAPWITYMKELTAMFSEDPEVRVVYNDEDKEVKLYVDSIDKANALEKILCKEKTFGNVTLKVTVYPPNTDDDQLTDIFYKALSGNPALSMTVPAQTVLGSFNYIVFENRVVQFFNDQLDDLNGNKSMLYQDIARDIFNPELNACYCTEALDKNLKKPLGEWP